MGALIDWVRCSFVTSSKESLSLTNHEVPIETFAAGICNVEVGKKEGEAIIPAVFKDCPAVCRNHGIHGRIDCGGGKPHKLGANVVAMSMLGLDFDHLTQEQYEAVKQCLLPLEHFWYETFSHAPPDDCRLRVLLPFAEELPLNAPSEWTRNYWPKLVASLGLLVGASNDKTCSDPARIYYAPRRPEGTERAAGWHRGQVLDWKKVVTLEAAQPELDVSNVVWEGEDLSKPVDMERIRKALEGVENHNKELIRKMLKGKPLSPRGGMHIAWRAVTSVLAMVAEPTDASAALLEFCMPSWIAEEAEYGHDQPFSYVENLLLGWRQKAPQLHAEKEAKRQAKVAEWRSRALLVPSVAGEPGEPGEEPPQEIQRYEYTEQGNSYRYVDQHSHQACYVGAWKVWLTWNGTHWSRDTNNTVLHLASETVRRLPLESEGLDQDAAERLMKHYENSQKLRFQQAMVTFSTKALSRTPDLFDRQPDLLNTPQGTLNLATGEISKPRPSDLLTRITRTVYVPGAECPNWLRLLEYVFVGNSDVIAYMKRVFGYALTGHDKEQCFFFMYGPAGSGKSTCVEVFNHVLGDYYDLGAPGLLIKRHNEAHPTAQADLNGLRMVVCQENDQGAAFDTSVLKQLVGSSKVKARKMGQDFSSFRATHKLFMLANDKPSAPESDDGLWRRLRLIQCAPKIPVADKEMPEKLAREAEGILAWAVEGAREWYEGGLREPECIQASTRAYQKDQDTLGDFLTDCFVLDPTHWLSRTQVRRAYENWAEAEGYHRTLSPRALAEGLRKKGIVDTERNVRGWLGLHPRGSQVTVPHRQQEALKDTTQEIQKSLEPEKKIPSA